MNLGPLGPSPFFDENPAVTRATFDELPTPVLLEPGTVEYLPAGIDYCPAQRTVLVHSSTCDYCSRARPPSGKCPTCAAPPPPVRTLEYSRDPRPSVELTWLER